MSLLPLKLVTIVSEAVLEDRLLGDLKRAGITGYTRSEVRGEGKRQVRDPWEGNNVKIEAVVTPEVAERVLDRLRESYLPIYPVIAWVSDVQAAIGEQIHRPR